MLSRHIAIAAATAALFLAGCSSNNMPAAQNISGNWQFSTSSNAATLPQLDGSLAGTTAAVTGTLHTPSTTACIPPQTLVTVTGAADMNNNLTLTSQPFASGSVLTITGMLAANGQSLTNAAYTASGGSCALAISPLVAAQYLPISGTYTGNFISSGFSLPVTATLTQTSQPDANGVFHIQGSANFSDPCVTNPVVTDSTVTGNTVSTTYTAQTTSGPATIVATGTFNNDASVLTITNWTLSGACGSDTGTGVLTMQ